MRTMLFDEEPWFNRFTVFTFAEGDGDDDGGDGDTGDDDADDDADDDDGDKGGADDKGKGGKSDEDTSGLKSALEKERTSRKALEKEAKQLRKYKEEAENKDKSEADKATAEASKSAEKVTKLAERLRRQSIESSIAKAATKLKFRDVDDAISLVKQDSITVEQDEDDPADIEIDEKSVEKAVKALADKKPHLLVAEGEGGRSGGKFGGGKKGNETDEDALARKYPALGRNRPPSSS